MPHFGSCRIGPIHFLVSWHTRPLNHALVSFCSVSASIGVWVFVLLLVVGMFNFVNNSQMIV